MRQRPSRQWVLLGLTPVMTLAVSCAVPVAQPTRESPVTETELPTATAPPDPGVDPPPLRLLAAGSPPLTPETRPQNQLVPWSESMADALNIPRAALQAYGYASTAVAQSAPECGLSWTVLAGIGAVESSHGRFGGAKLDRTGRPSIPVVGPPLDGSPGVKRIDDTDRGELDGDQVWDRAVGPLQFIPQTWREWAVDADGDGAADPNDLDDAALAAAEYLCHVAGDMRIPDRFWTALLDYNASREYGQDVLDRADDYGRRSRALPVAR
ncbi:transglycosylase protein with SLT domain [Saccharopolyspora erythraea NRRL 2338]|uniref:Lytic murein transglycosylase n=2 Tax=Saccharopolyspora erythraea TaxID=1836 RepID=A0ABP3MXM8_SACER|nr:lytic murein transglycosylase [Saccharopolyspora erythraea]EQD85779.1 murein transglycosylase [Saccharopolyspora erythraea D]PFG93972.1 transglycosylase protein with SLT domain [Saccharopolyspora erythraea NRRL 2338]CAM00175.1 similar to membrane-bound lytic murein transglycosylase B [Saccharopolyspora erythraea NRRL 2338]